MTEKTEAATARRPYQPPQLEQVQLVAEEAVLEACKTSRGEGGPKSDPYCVPGTRPPCFGEGT